MKRSTIKIIRAMRVLALLLLFFSVVAYYANPIWLGGRAPLGIGISLAFVTVLLHFFLEYPELSKKRDAEKESFHDMLEKLSLRTKILSIIVTSIFLMLTFVNYLSHLGWAGRFSMEVAVVSVFPFATALLYLKMHLARRGSTGSE